MAGTLRKIRAVAALALGEAVRSRFVPATAAAVALAVAAISRSVAPSLDGTGADSFQNFTFYSLAAVSTLLYVAAIVTGAAAVSGETRAMTLQLARVKPISMASFLFGRWLGLLAAFAALLAFAFAVVLALAPKAPDGFCCERVAPSFPDVRGQAEEVVREAARGGVTDPAELSRIRRDALAKLPYATVPLQPGEMWRFKFPGAGPADTARGVRAAIAFSSDAYSAVPLEASLWLENARGDRATDSASIGGVTSRRQVFHFDASPLAGESDIVLAVKNESPADAMPLLLQPRQSVALLLPSCPTAINFLWAFATMLPVVALLLALGLALGSFFSLPVAAFCATCAIITVFVADYSAGDPDILEIVDTPATTSLDLFAGRVSVATVRAVAAASRTALSPSPAAALAANERVTAATAGASALWNGLLLPAAALLAAASVLERKELPR